MHNLTNSFVAQRICRVTIEFCKINQSNNILFLFNIRRSLPFRKLFPEVATVIKVIADE